MTSIPAAPGAYALVLRLESTPPVVVGRLGTLSFSPGIYIYLGSACGPGGLRARLGRHLAGPASRPRWHIDYLRAAAKVRGYFYTLQAAKKAIPWECAWSQAIGALPGAGIPVPGFGASDCRSGCPAHLVGLPAEMLAPSLPASLLARLMAELVGGKIIAAECSQGLHG